MVAGILFLGAAIRSFFGFGDAAVAMPLLALLGIQVEAAVPLVGAAGLAVALAALFGGAGSTDLAALKRLTLSTLVGIPFGVLLVTHGSETLITRSLGSLLVAYGGYSLAGPTLPHLRRHGWALVFGFMAGSLGGAYNFNGVPVAVFGTMRRWPADRFRGTLQAHFVVSSTLVVAGQGIGGLWTTDVLELTCRRAARGAACRAPRSASPPPCHPGAIDHVRAQPHRCARPPPRAVRLRNSGEVAR